MYILIWRESEVMLSQDMHLGALGTIKSRLNLNRDFGLNHTVSGGDLRTGLVTQDIE